MAESPILRQYREIKSRYQDELLLFRMGDFYELFFEDAEIAARVLGITLTSKPLSKTQRVPMAGVPVRAADTYIARLLKAGYRVAICEQMEDEPQKGRGLLHREVVEVITPGTILDPALLEDKNFQFIAAVNPTGLPWGVALLDLSTADFLLFEAPPQRALEELEKRGVVELILPRDTELPHPLEAAVYPLEEWHFDPDTARRELMDHFQVASLRAFEVDNLPRALGAALALLEYLRDKKPGMLQHLRNLKPLRLQQTLYLDPATLKNLEVLEPIHEGGLSLLQVLDETLTPMGGRFLREALIAPLLDLQAIRTRLHRIQTLLEHREIHDTLRTLLRDIGDVERMVSRFSARKAGPREARKLAESLHRFEEIRQLLEPYELFRPLLANAPQLLDLAQELVATVVENPPASVREGGFIRPEVSRELAELLDLAHHGKTRILALEQRERERTGIASLKIGYNNVLGYYIEVTKANLSRVPQDYIRKQTLTNAERFYTPELKELEARILSAEERARRLELEIWEQLRRRVVDQAPGLKAVAATIAELDFLQSQALVARKRRYVMPEVVDDGTLRIQEGRHPMVEVMIDEPFVPNDTEMDLHHRRIFILTGPNMSGKSTFLRQVALITLMAQMGTFVPASKAHIGLVDRIFTRIGASDDLARGVSTFMAEMIETANILRNATRKSLVILDEVGRGTSTFDGLAIAWAVVEYLLNRVGAKTLFATHYHQLSKLGKMYPAVKNFTTKVKEWEGKVIFLRKVVPGETDRSYGIHVARLAGIPEEVVRRAQEIQEDIEREGTIRTRLTQLDLFQPAPSVPKAAERVLQRLKSVDLDGLSPRDALNLLYELKKEVES